MAIIEVDHVTKEFRLGQLHGLKTSALNALKRLRGAEPEQRKVFKALDDVTLSVEQGEVVGIIGHNGAGKSTLLKLLAGISRPSSGNIRVQGRIAPLIEVGAGLVPDLTGRENIFLNATILGMKRAEVVRKFDDIVAFAELEEFVDTPIKRYSSGMQVRLGFSIATSVDAGILIVDEVLAVGDLAFQRKCFERMETLIKDQGRTVLIVAHNLRQIERICERVVILDHGALVADGDAPEICNQFFEMNDAKVREQVSKAANPQNMTGDVHLLDIKLLDESGTETDVIEYHSSPTFLVRIRVENALDQPSFYFGIHTIDFFYIDTSACPSPPLPDRLEPGTYTIAMRIDQFPFINGAFSVRVRIECGEVGKGSMGTIVFYGENLFHFKANKADLVRTRLEAEGIVSLPLSWSLEQDSDSPRVVDSSAAGPLVT